MADSMKLWDRIPAWAMLSIAVGGSIMGLAVAGWDLGRDVEDVHEWQESHLVYHNERSTVLDTQLAAINARLAGFDEVRRRTDELTFRLGAAEENARRTGEAITALQQSVNAQASDIRVMREILERLDERRRAALHEPGGAPPH